MGKRFVFMAILLLCFLSVNAQNPSFVNPTPPSPTAAELGKYGIVPVDMFHGTPQVEIPLYSLEAGKFSLPIKLTYNAGGVRIEDISSWIGLGWSLEAGGVISITTNDKSDFCRTDRIRLDEQAIRSLDVDPSTFINTYGKTYDSEPDYFNFNFCGYAGQFVLDGSLNPIVLKDGGNLRFRCEPSFNSTGELKSLRIIANDNNGRTYLFNDCEMTSSKDETAQYNALTGQMSGYYTSNAKNELTAVYLSKIILEDNSEISFFYKNEIQKYKTRYSGSISTKRFDISEFDLSNIYPVRKDINTSTKVLERITYNKNQKTIYFTSNANRLDLKNASRLQGIDVYNDSSMIRLLDRYQLMQDYFQSNVEVTDPYYFNSLDKRLKLLGVKRIGVDGAELTPWLFTYFGDSESLKLPFRTSYSGNDSYGFCNSTAYNSITTSNFSNLFSKEVSLQSSGLCPNKLVNGGHCSTTCIGGLPVPSNAPVTYSSYEACSKDRYALTNFRLPSNLGESKLPNLRCTQIGTLASIKYPTGGEVKFTYELNSYRYYVNDDLKVVDGYRDDYTYGGLRVKQIRTISGSDTTEKSYVYSNGIALFLPTNAVADLGVDESGGVGSSPICSCNFLYRVFPNELNPYYNVNGGNMGYGKVEEITSGGSTVYSYITARDFDLSSKKNFIAYFQPFDVKTLKGTNNLKLWGCGYFYQKIAPYFQGTIANSYVFGSLNYVAKLNTKKDTVSKDVYKYLVRKKGSIVGNQFFNYANTYCTITSFEVEQGQVFNAIKESNTYDKGKLAVRSTTNYEYNYDYGQVISETTQGSSNRYKTTYVYCNDQYMCDNSLQYSSIPIIAMRSKGMYSYPIETVNYVNDKVVDATLNIYKSSNGTAALSSIYRFNLTNPMSNIKPFRYVDIGGRYEMDPNYRFKLGNASYDFKGNLLSYLDEVGINNFFIYDNDSRIVSYITTRNNVDYNCFMFSSFDQVDEQINLYSSTVFDGWTFGYGPTWIAKGNDKIGGVCVGTTYTGNPLMKTQRTFPAGIYKVSWSSRRLTNGVESTVVPQINTMGFFATNLTNGDWKDFSATIILTVESQIGLYINNSLIDNIRISPSNIPIKQKLFLYERNGLLKHIYDERMNYEKYNYDNFLRLLYIQDIFNNIKAGYKYNYSNRIN